MDFKAYIQSLNGVPQNDWAFTAYMGFSRRGTKIILFEEIEEVPASKFNIVVAHIDETRRFFERLNIVIPGPLNIPEELLQYAKRKIEVKTIKEFKETVTLPIFVKPAAVVKGFMAGILTDENSLKSFYAFFPNEGITDETMVMTSEVIDIVSEYRGFVVDRKLKFLNLYSGDFRFYPDCKIIEQAINDFKSSPIGYSIDFGVTSSGETVLIECQDAWSIGSYGCDPVIYTDMICKRWLELVKFK